VFLTSRLLPGRPPVFTALDLRAQRTSKRTHRIQKRRKQGKRKMSSFITCIFSIQYVGSAIYFGCGSGSLPHEVVRRYNIDFMAPSRAIPGFPVPRCFSSVKGDIGTNPKAQLVQWAHLQRETEHRMQNNSTPCVYEVSRKH